MLPSVRSSLRPLAAALTLALAPAEAAGQPPAPEAAAASVAEPDGGKKPGPEEGRPPEPEDSWIDVGHAFIEQRIFAPILRLDRFFSDERDLDAERERSFIRWRNEVRFSEDASRPAFTTGVRVNLRLAGLNKQLRRLRLVIASETRDAIQSLFPRPPGSPIAEEEDTTGTGNAGLRFFVLDTVISHADLGAGVLLRVPPGAYGQLRFRVALPVGKVFLTRSVATGFWRTDTRFGTSAGLELERPLNATFVARLTGSGTLTERSHGVEWVSEAALLAFLGPRTAGQLALSANGVTRPPVVATDPLTLAETRAPELDRFRLYTRLRRDLYRRWVFAELEPEMAWPWTLEKGRHGAWGVAIRLEVQFQGKEAPPAPAPALPPEPQDPPPPPEPQDPAPPDSLPGAPGPG